MTTQIQLDLEMATEFRSLVLSLTAKARQYQAEEKRLRERWKKAVKERKRRETALDRFLDQQQGAAVLDFAAGVQDVVGQVEEAQLAELEARNEYRSRKIQRRTAALDLQVAIKRFHAPLPLFDREAVRPPPGPVATPVAEVEIDGETHVIEKVDPFAVSVHELGLGPAVLIVLDREEFRTLDDIRTYAGMERRGLAEALETLFRSRPAALATAQAIATYLGKHGLRCCRVCGCIEADCSICVEKTGQPCHWVEADLCSACVPAPASNAAAPGDLVTVREGAAFRLRSLPDGRALGEAVVPFGNWHLNELPEGAVYWPDADDISLAASEQLGTPLRLHRRYPNAEGVHEFEFIPGEPKPAKKKWSRKKTGEQA